MEENKEVTQEVKGDVFGEVPTEADIPKKEEEKKEYPDIPEDHPVVKSLKEEIEMVKKEYGGNLSEQRRIIKELEKKIKEEKSKEAEKGNSDDPNLPFPNIKYSKDLSEEEREEYTELELKQMDAIAKMQELENKRYLESKAKEEKKVEDIQSTVKAGALELAGNDVELANKIIESVKRFNLNGLTESEIKERLQDAYKLIPEYTPPKETTKKIGGAVKGKTSTDPFDVDSLIEKYEEQGGDYTL